MEIGVVCLIAHSLAPSFEAAIAGVSGALSGWREEIVAREFTIFPDSQRTRSILAVYLSLEKPQLTETLSFKRFSTSIVVERSLTPPVALH